MTRIFVTTAIAGALALGLTSAAFAVTGEFNDMCAEGLALHKQVKTDCSINAQVDGKTYCFGNAQAKTDFMKNSSANLRKAERYYTKHQG